MKLHCFAKRYWVTLSIGILSTLSISACGGSNATIDSIATVVVIYAALTICMDFTQGPMALPMRCLSGWKKTLAVLMNKCLERAIRDGLKFEKFSLQDCRPKGVTDKLDQGQTDVMVATLHTSERMITQTYNRRRLKCDACQMKEYSKFGIRKGCKLAVTTLATLGIVAWTSYKTSSTTRMDAEFPRFKKLAYPQKYPLQSGLTASITRLATE